MELLRVRICTVLLLQPRGGGGKQGAIHPHGPRMQTSAAFPFRRGSGGNFKAIPAPEHQETAGCLLMRADLFVEEKAAVFLRVPLGTPRTRTERQMETLKKKDRRRGDEKEGGGGRDSQKPVSGQM